MDLYSLNKDVLVKIICIVREDLEKEITIKDKIIEIAAVKYYRCNVKGCEAFVVNGRFHKYPISICHDCGICYCSKHNLNRIFADLCIRCAYPPFK